MYNEVKWLPSSKMNHFERKKMPKSGQKFWLWKWSFCCLVALPQLYQRCNFKKFVFFIYFFMQCQYNFIAVTMTKAAPIIEPHMYSHCFICSSFPSWFITSRINFLSCKGNNNVGVNLQCHKYRWQVGACDFTLLTIFWSW